MAKELEIGKRYNLCNIIYEVVEDTTVCCLLCGDCAFFIEKEGVCADAHRNKMGPCVGRRRSDGKNVIFVKVGEGNDPHPDGNVHEVTSPNN